MIKKLYTIKLLGCDDSTIWNQKLNESEYTLLKDIEKRSKNISDCSCMPVLKIIKKGHIHPEEICYGYKFKEKKTNIIYKIVGINDSIYTVQHRNKQLEIGYTELDNNFIFINDN